MKQLWSEKIVFTPCSNSVACSWREEGVASYRLRGPLLNEIVRINISNQYLGNYAPTPPLIQLVIIR